LKEVSGEQRCGNGCKVLFSVKNNLLVLSVRRCIKPGLLNLLYMRTASEKFGPHVGNMKFNIQKEG